MKSEIGRTLVSQARKVAVAAAAGAVLALGAAGASAQPAGGMHGMHGGGAPFEIGHLLERAKASLNLNTQQQAMWDNVVAQSKAAHEAARTNRQQIKAALTAELAKPEPDLGAIAAVADNVEQQNRTTRVAVRQQWLQLYATFSPEQKGVVKTMLQNRLAHMEAFGAKMRERFQGMHPSTN